jgi:hypothetical protein
MDRAKMNDLFLGYMDQSRSAVCDTLQDLHRSIHDHSAISLGAVLAVAIYLVETCGREQAAEVFSGLGAYFEKSRSPASTRNQLAGIIPFGHA